MDSKSQVEIDATPYLRLEPDSAIPGKLSEASAWMTSVPPSSTPCSTNGPLVLQRDTNATASASSTTTTHAVVPNGSIWPSGDLAALGWHG
jgi:hypothetical protein